MSIRSLSLVAVTVGVLSACTPHYLTRDLLCNREGGGKAASRAARCVTAAAYEISQKKAEKPRDQPEADQGEGKETDPRFEEWIP